MRNNNTICVGSVKRGGKFSKNHFTPSKSNVQVNLILLKLKSLSELEIMEMELSDDVINSSIVLDPKTAFIEAVRCDFDDHVAHNKVSIEKLAKKFGITNQNEVKELVELAIVLQARYIIEYEKEPYNSLVDLYKMQPNLSHRTSNSIAMMQYSTPAPISYLCGMYVKHGQPANAKYYEPTAGNGLLSIALPYDGLVVNELDKKRLEHLQRQPFAHITNEDATTFVPKMVFDGIICNPPFGKTDKEYTIDTYKIGGLEQAIAIHALKTMHDNGRACIIVGGHTRYEEKKRGTFTMVRGGIDRYFLNYLYKFYNVEDIISIDGHALYSRQGTAFDTRIILINGRKKVPKGFAHKTHKLLDDLVMDFNALQERFKLNLPKSK